MVVTRLPEHVDGGRVGCVANQMGVWGFDWVGPDEVRVLGYGQAGWPMVSEYFAYRT